MQTYSAKDPGRFTPKKDDTYSAESLYLNEKIHDLANVARAERTDHRYAEQILGTDTGLPSAELEKVFPNVFFGTRKQFGSPRIAPSPVGATPTITGVTTVNTLLLNIAVMAAFALAGLVAVHAILRRQLRKV